MAQEISYDQALKIAYEALERYQQAQTKSEVEEIFIKYGRHGIGYRKLCKMFFSGVLPEKAVKAYKNV